MRIDSKRGLSILVGALLIICWTAVVLIIGKPEVFGFAEWFSFLYVPVCVLVAWILHLSYASPKNDAGTIGIPIYYTMLLIALAIFISAAFIFSGYHHAAPFVIAAEIILLIVYFAIISMSVLYRERLPKKVFRSEEDTAFHTSVSHSLGTMLSVSSDKEIKNALLELKEIVDYSTNASSQGTDEREIIEKIGQIETLMRSGENMDSVMKAITDANHLWKARNAKL